MNLIIKFDQNRHNIVASRGYITKRLYIYPVEQQLTTIARDGIGGHCMAFQVAVSMRGFTEA